MKFINKRSSHINLVLSNKHHNKSCRWVLLLLNLFKTLEQLLLLAKVFLPPTSQQELLEVASKPSMLKTLRKTDASTDSCFSILKVIYFICNLKAYPYFELLVGLEQYISGVILYEETLYQKADDGTDFVALLNQKGIIPGIKVISIAVHVSLVILLRHFVDRWIRV